MSIRKILNDQRKIDRIAKVVFNSVDKDGSGLIDMNELEVVMNTISKDMGLPKPSKTEVKDVFVLLDTDNSGMVSYNEFKRVIKGILESLV